MCPVILHSDYAVSAIPVPDIEDRSTFALCANADPKSVIALLRHACQYLLRTLAQIDLLAQADILRQLDAQQHAALFGGKDEAPEHRLDPEHRRLRLQATVLACQHLQGFVRLWLAKPLSEPDRQPLSDWLVRIDKILADEVSIQRHELDGAVFVSELPKDKKGAYRIASAVDPDATLRLRSGQAIPCSWQRRRKDRLWLQRQRCRHLSLRP